MAPPPLAATRLTNARRSAALPACCLTVLLLLALPCAGNAAGVYKWTDEQGRSHYGDKPPTENAVPVDVDDAPTPSAAQSTQQEEEQRLLKVMEEERTEKKAQRAEQEQMKEQRKANCDAATRQLQTIEGASFLWEPGSDPKNPKILSKAERDAETAQARKTVQEWCK